MSFLFRLFVSFFFSLGLIAFSFMAIMILELKEVREDFYLMVKESDLEYANKLDVLITSSTPEVILIACIFAVIISPYKAKKRTPKNKELEL